MRDLTQFERDCYECIVRDGEAALARWPANARMSAVIRRNVDDARRKLAGVAA